MLSWGKRNKYIERWLSYFLAHCTSFYCLIRRACPGFVETKAYTIGGKNTTLKKEYQITNSELEIEMNIYLELKRDHITLQI